MLYHFFTKTIGLLAKLYCKVWFSGYERIPKKKPAIMASNHLAVIDSIILPITVWRKIWFIGKKEYFQTDTLKHRFIKWIFESVSVHPVDRSGGKASEGGLNVGRKALDSGHLFGIYPEGTRSPDGFLYKGHTGVAKLALEKQVPVVTVAMIATREAQPPHCKKPKSMRCGIIFGGPLEFSNFYSEYDKATKEENRQVIHDILRKVTDEIMMDLHSHSGQVYIDMYAQEAKEVIASAKEDNPNISETELNLVVLNYAKTKGYKVLDSVIPENIKFAKKQGPQL
ncbi:MAG: 1-acyl-sn-glycerol-3-phosphate acyltransferase [Candidatus Ancillula sp.]|jgi:1-acyl-sn-glycerol-3-phosphate acyltransferase|nr:1-acyl-sn-glycerol-3-phosphate acyltransferase [Candidatus Ancillula sp.]